MDMLEAVKLRHSVRHYTDSPIEAEKVKLLRDSVNAINKKTGLHFQLITDEPEGFTGALAHYGNISRRDSNQSRLTNENFFVCKARICRQAGACQKLSHGRRENVACGTVTGSSHVCLTGVKNYFVLAGPKKLDREVGYYGEQLVLEAQTLGLNTCWVALTFNKRKARYELGRGEKLYMVIALGYGSTQGKAHTSRPAGEISDLNDSSPDWYKRGIECVLLAPTAVNQQKFYFSLDGDKVTSKAGNGFYTDVDLGIAQYHFDLAAEKRCFGLE